MRRRNTTSLAQENPALIHIPSDTSTLSSRPPTPKTLPPQSKTPPPPRQTPQRQPPPHMAVALSQDVTKVTFKIAGFYGDDSDKKEALNHITQLRFTCRTRDPLVHNVIIDLFSFTLLGLAQDWWQDQAVWTGKNKADYTVIVSEWMKRWLAKQRRTKLQHEKVSEFRELALGDSEVGKKIMVDGEEVYTQVEFVQQLRKKARACGDQNLMVSQGIAKLLPCLCEALGPSYVDFNTWEELVDAVVALSPARIELADQALTTRDKVNALFSSSERSNTPPLQYTNPQPQAPYQPYYSSPRFQQPWNSWLPLRTSIAQSSPLVDPYGEITLKNAKEVKLEHEDTKEGWQSYARAIEDWNEKWGSDVQPTPARPYPIRPNAPPVGEVCCWNCGGRDHMAGSCPTDRSQYLPEKEREWRRQRRGGGRIPRNTMQTPQEGFPQTPTRGGAHYTLQLPFRPRFPYQAPATHVTHKGPITAPNFNRESSVLWLNELKDPALIRSPYYMPQMHGEVPGQWEFVPYLSPYEYEMGQGNGGGLSSM